MTWTFDALTIALLSAGTVLYGRGIRVAWQHGGRGAIFRAWHVAAYAAGLLALAVALLSPLAALSALFFSAHMTQHEMLMLVAAPLLVMGQPLLAWLWAVPEAQRPGVARACRGRWILAAWRWLTAPLAVFLLHGVALWIWHVPVLFEWALRDDWVHGAQHVSFVVTAALFWWGMVHGRYGRAGYGVGVLYVFLTAMHSTLLGALLTLGPTVWYRSYANVAMPPHTDALEDQQLAGLIMWVPSGAVFTIVGLALVAAWLGEAERRARLGSVSIARRIGVAPRRIG